MLIEHEGRWRGHLCFPVGSVVVFTGIRRAEVEASAHRTSWEAVFSPTNTVLADSLRAWAALDDAALAEAFRPFFRRPFEMRQPFTARQIDYLRWVLFPESRLDAILGQTSTTAEKVMAVLDARQEQHAQALGSGHRILFGVAGSGKTILLLARARLLARLHPERRTLLVCYNKVLAAWLGKRLADCPQVTVRHFDALAKDLGLGRKSGDADNAALGARMLAELQRPGRDKPSWDAILIDEAQDFEPTWFQCLLELMKDREDGDLVIVGDGSQLLYRKGRLSWKALGIKAQGRASSSRFDLDKNYRNTPKIAALACAYGEDVTDDDGIRGQRVAPNRCRRINVSAPVFIPAENHAAQVDAAQEIVGRWLRGERGGRKSEPLQPSEIGIFYPQLASNGPLIERLVAGLSQLAPTRWLSDGGDRSAHLKVNDPAIKIQTIHSAKGLQYKAVIVLWTDLLPRTGSNPESERCVLYVAITRAENDLVLLGSGSRGFASELEKQCAVRPWPFAGAGESDRAA